MRSALFRNLLEQGDVHGLRTAWAELAPQMPQPETEAAAEVAMHIARTATESIPFKCRAWSHRWLSERDLPSQLPDRLRPSAEQLCPRVVSAVGISVKTNNPYFEPVVTEVRKAMETAVEEAYADNRKDPEFVTARMQDARARTWKALFGI